MKLWNQAVCARLGPGFGLFWYYAVSEEAIYPFQGGETLRCRDAAEEWLRRGLLAWQSAMRLALALGHLAAPEWRFEALRGGGGVFKPAGPSTFGWVEEGTRREQAFL